MTKFRFMYGVELITDNIDVFLVLHDIRDKTIKSWCYEEIVSSPLKKVSNYIMELMNKTD